MISYQFVALFFSCAFYYCEGNEKLFGVSKVETTEAKLNVTYTGNVSADNMDIYRYHYKEIPHKVR